MDLFGTNNYSNDFYFLNPVAKTQGYADFKAKWGGRPNTDNWQRQAAATKSFVNTLTAVDVADKVNAASGLQPAREKDLSFDSMQANIPLTPGKMEVSNNAIAQALLSNAQTFQNTLEDYPAAIDAYEQLILRFPQSPLAEKAIFNLTYLYTKAGMNDKADALRHQMSVQFPNSQLGSIAPKNAALSSSANPATKAYEHVYNLFLEGDFGAAREEKLKADNVYGKSYWTPQLLYIESIYYVKQRQDSIAINRLQALSSGFPTSPLAAKAKTMIDVLKRRNQIESYLTNLDIERNQDMAVRSIDLDSTNVTALNRTLLRMDSSSRTSRGLPAVPDKKLQAIPQPLVVTSSGFSFNAADQHYVAVVFDKVDEVFSSEARNAFNRYNQEKSQSPRINISGLKLDDRYNIMLIGPFADAGEAIGYLDKTKPAAASQIVPWLSASKYTFTIISEANLTVLKSNKNIDSYQEFMKQTLPGKF